MVRKRFSISGSRNSCSASSKVCGGVGAGILSKAFACRLITAAVRLASETVFFSAFVSQPVRVRLPLVLEFPSNLKLRRSLSSPGITGNAVRPVTTSVTVGIFGSSTICSRLASASPRSFNCWLYCVLRAATRPEGNRFRFSIFKKSGSFREPTHFNAPFVESNF